MRSKNGSRAKDVVRLKSEDIGAPLNFSHVVHVAPRPLVSVNLEDPHIQAFLKQAGVSEDQLSNLAVYETIVNFIQVHGVENVKKEVDEAASDAIDSPADNKSGARQQEAEGENTRRDASPSFLSRLLFRGRKKSNVESAGVAADESKEEIKEAASHRIEVETVEAVEKEIDEGEKLLEHGEEEFEEAKKRKKRFSFKRKDAEAPQEEQQQESKGSFFSRHWGKNKQQDAAAHETKKIKAEEVPAEPKKSTGIFRLNLKKTRASSSSSSASDDEETVNLNPEVDYEDIQVEPAAKPPKKQLTFFKSKTKRAASADELQQSDKAPGEEDKDASSDDEGKKKHAKRDFFKFKSKKAVAVEVHQESALRQEVAVQEETADQQEIVVHQETVAAAEEIEKEPDYAQVQKPSKLFGFVKGPKNKKEPAPEVEKEYDKLENEEQEEIFDETFKKEAEVASKLNIIPNKKDGSKRKKKSSDASKKDKRSSLEKTGSGFFSFGSSKQKKEPVEQQQVPEAPWSDLPEENKHKIRKYKVKRMAGISNASLQSAGDASSSDEQEGAKQPNRSRKSRKTSKTETDRKQHASSDDEQPIGMFKRIFSRRSASETRVAKKEKEKKRRSSVDAVLVTKVAETVQTAEEQTETVVAEEKAIVDPIYENFPQKLDPDKSTDEEADEYYAQYHQELRELTQTRRSWSFVMAELKEKMTSGEEEEQLEFQMKTIEVEAAVETNTQGQNRRSSSSSDDPLEQIKRSVEKLDEEFARRAQAGVAAVQQPVEPEEPGYVNVEELQQQLLQLPQQQIQDQEQPEEAAQQNESRRSRLPLPTRSRSSDASSSSEEECYSTPVDTSLAVVTSPSSSEQKTLSDSIEPDSLEAKTYSDSVQSPLSRVSSISQDSLDSNQDKNNNGGDVTLRSSAGKAPLRQSSSLLSNSESRPLSDCHLKLADNTISLSEEPPQITEVMVKTGRRLERGSRVSKRPTSSMSSSNDDSSSLPTSPVQKLPVLEPVIQKEVKKSSSSSSSFTSSSSKGDSIPSSTEDLARSKQGSDKENVEIRRELANDDDVFIPEERETVSSPGKRASVERNASYHRAVEKSGSLPLPRKNGQPGRRSSSNASRIPRPILKKPRRRTVDNWPSTHKVTEL